MNAGPCAAHPPFDRGEPAAHNAYQTRSAQAILASHLRLLGRPLLADADAPDAPARLYGARFAVLAHDTAPDPVFFYANLVAQRLFEMDWSQMVSLPSRRSAEAPAQGERRRLLERVSRLGFIDDYEGIRISASGGRFRIRGATVWNVIEDAVIVGQAAAFAAWTPLEPGPLRS